MTTSIATGATPALSTEDLLNLFDDQNLTCKLCYNISEFPASVRLLQEGHPLDVHPEVTICVDCLFKNMAENIMRQGMKCPICRQEISTVEVDTVKQADIRNILRQNAPPDYVSTAGIPLSPNAIAQLNFAYRANRRWDWLNAVFGDHLREVSLRSGIDSESIPTTFHPVLRGDEESECFSNCFDCEESPSCWSCFYGAIAIALVGFCSAVAAMVSSIFCINRNQ